MSAVTATPRLRRGTHVGYALGSIGTAAFGTVPGLLLLYYLTDVLGVAAGIAGLVVFAPKAWDVVLNPWIGNRSDRTESRWGPRRPWMLAGGLALPPLFVLVFAGPGTPPALAAVWVAAAFLLAATAYGCFQVPYVAQPAEITDDPGERATLMSWRVAALALGILLAGAGAPAVVDAFGGGRGGYLAMAVFVALLLAGGMLGAVVGTRNAPTLTRTHSEGRLLATLAVAWRVRPFRLLLLGFVVQALGIGVMLAGVPYYSEQVLGDPAAGTLLFVASWRRRSWSCRCGCASAGDGASAAACSPHRCCSPWPRPCSRSSRTAGRPRRSRSSSWSGSATPGCRCSRWPCSPT